MTTEVGQNRVQEAIDRATSELESLKNKLALMRWFQRHIEPIVPEGVELGNSMYDYWSKTSIDLTIPTVEGREWEGPNGTAGLIYRTRKAFNVEKLNREVYAWGESVHNTYDGRGSVMVNGEECTVHINIKLGSQLPPTCKIEWEEKEVTTTQKVGKVVCE